MPNETNSWMAVLWLSILIGVAVAYLIHVTRRSDYTLWESCLYLPTYLLGRLLWRVHFKNEPPEEMRGGAVLVANHRSSVDPCFVQLAANRRVHWMVAKEYFGHFLIGPFLRAVRAIPTNRSGMDTAATRQAMRITREGRLVGMFPEGRLNHTRRPLVSIRSGAALVAIRSGVPMIPLLIEGSPYRRAVWSPLLMPAHVAITFGEPIYPCTAGDDNRNGSPNATDRPAIATSPSSSAPMDAEEPLDSERSGLESRDPQAATLVESDILILQWGRQIVRMAGVAHFPVELVSKRRHRRRPDVKIS